MDIDEEDISITVTSDGVEVCYDGNTTSATYVLFASDTMTFAPWHHDDVRTKGHENI